MDTRVEIITNNISYMFVFKTFELYRHAYNSSSTVKVFIESPCILCCVYLHIVLRPKANWFVKQVVVLYLNVTIHEYLY